MLDRIHTVPTTPQSPLNHSSHRNASWLVRLAIAGLLALPAACTGASAGSAGGDGVLFNQQPIPAGIAADEGELFWSHCSIAAPGGGGICRAKHDGSDPVAISAAGGIRDVFVVGDSLYYMQHDKAFRLPRMGGTPTMVASPAYAMAQMDHRVYVLEADQPRSCSGASVLVFDEEGHEQQLAASAPCGDSLAVSEDVIVVAQATAPYPNAATAFSSYSPNRGEWTVFAEIEGEVRAPMLMDGVVYFLLVRPGSRVVQGLALTGEPVSIEGQNDEAMAFTVLGDRLLAVSGDDLAPPTLSRLSTGRLETVLTLPEDVRSVWALVGTEEAIYWTGRDLMSEGVVGRTLWPDDR